MTTFAHGMLLFSNQLNSIGKILFGSNPDNVTVEGRAAKNRTSVTSLQVRRRSRRLT
jgi:hypothetical protein